MQWSHETIFAIVIFKICQLLEALPGPDPTRASLYVGALSSKPAARCSGCRTMRQTNGQTDGGRDGQRDGLIDRLDPQHDAVVRVVDCDRQLILVLHVFSCLLCAACKLAY